MEYALILLFQLVGIGFHVLQKVMELDKLAPDDTLTDVFKLFWKSDRVTTLVSGLIMFGCLIAYFAVEHYAPTLLEKYQYHQLYAFGISLVLGYAGQSLIYKWLGTAQSFLEKKANDKLN